jgi:threonine aldolase
VLFLNDLSSYQKIYNINSRTEIKMKMEYVDLRSDTVTQPTPEMRKLMAEAVVGDDVFGEDPTINRLQKMGAERMGKEAGLFISSGTMGNLIATLCHCQRGEEAIMGNLAHTFILEGGGVAALGGVMPHTVPNQPDGTLRLEDIKGAIRPDDVHQPPTKLIIIENTQNRCGGAVLTAEYTRQVAKIAHDHNFLIHLDGARVFNAAAALGIEVTQLTAPVDSVTFCLSKGLCAPVGSVLCGSEEFIHKARRLRKMLGGAMRQAGILAAAGIYALEHMVDRLPEDHMRARALAEGLSKIPGITLKDAVPPSNMVFVNLDDSVKTTPAQIVERLKSENIRVGVTGPRQFRLVTHYWIDDQGVEASIKAFKKAL